MSVSPIWPAGSAVNAEGEITFHGRTAASLLDEFGSPLYVIDTDDVRARATKFVHAASHAFNNTVTHVSFAGKALLSKEICRIVTESGMPIDTCTMGEMRIALAAGVPGRRLVLHGNNKSDAEKLTDNKVCVVGMGPVVNSEVSIDDIKMDDLKKIFTGEITNWKEVGGQDLDITVINRASGSGTRAVFEKAVLNGTKVPDSFRPQEQDSSGTAAKMVKDTPGAISYLAFSYYDSSIKALSVDGVKPETSTVETNDWKIWAYEHMYTAKEADEATQAFIDFMMSDEVQGSLVSENGYISVSGMKVSRDADGNVTKL